MTRDTRNNLIVGAVAFSLLAHLGMMLWAKPHVMTHAFAGVVRAVKRGPMRVSEAPPELEPHIMSSVPDEAAKHEAPITEEMVAPLPSDKTVLAEGVPSVAPPEPALPVLPVELAEPLHLPEIDGAVLTAPFVTVRPKMVLETPTVTSGSAGAVGFPELKEVAASPTFEAPAFSPEVHVGNVTRGFSQTTPATTFVPVEDVMTDIDEKIVEQEKAAVRDLLDADCPLDMSQAVELSLETCIANGFTYFRVTAHPKEQLPTVPKDVVILMDASGSIGHDRLASCRKHVREILRTAMNTGDRFNLVAFRDKFSYCFQTWHPCDAPSFAEADTWIGHLAAHGRTDVFASIASVLTLPRDPTRPLVALVVTDGVANAGVSATGQILSWFTHLNDGLISVYMYGVKDESNRALIDALTHANRGESFVFDGRRWNAGTGIGSFSERFRDPLVTDLRVFFPSSYAVEVYPGVLKNVYRGNTVSFVGRLKGTPDKLLLSLRGIAGTKTYDGMFWLSVMTSRTDATLPAVWQAEHASSMKYRF